MAAKGNGQTVGYVRVSSLEQNPDRQIQELNTYATIDRVFQDSLSGGKSVKRPALDECKHYLRDGDELVVSSIDRLARSLADLRALVDELTEKGVTITFLHEHLTFSKDSSDPRADLMLGILGSFAEFERAIIRERQAEGIALAKKAGKYRGRKRVLNAKQVREIRLRIAAGETKAAIARDFGIARATLYSALKHDPAPTSD